jgi:hypothetical protein
MTSANFIVDARLIPTASTTWNLHGTRLEPPPLEPVNLLVSLLSRAMAAGSFFCIVDRQLYSARPLEATHFRPIVLATGPYFNLCEVFLYLFLRFPFYFIDIEFVVDTTIVLD